MRRVDRNRVSLPSALSGLNSRGKKEEAEAKKHYDKELAAGNESGKPSYEFKAYKDPSIKQALEILFHGKCAYCESRYASIHPVDIEHWRPKARVVDEGGKSYRFGYYWLAADWDNLLPSCIDCNRQREHIDALTGQKLTIGKADWFPLDDPAKRAKSAAEISGETPLLINPCTDEPSDFIRVHEEGYVLPQESVNELQGKRAIASIQYYALNRIEIVKDRRERILLLQRHMISIRSIIRILDQRETDVNVRELLEEMVAYEFDALERLRDPAQPFSAMADELISAFRNELAGTSN